MTTEAAASVEAAASMKALAAVETVSREGFTVEASVKAPALKRMPVPRSERRSVRIEVVIVVAAKRPRCTVHVKR